MRETTTRRLTLGIVLWGLVPGLITLAAGLAGLSWGTHLNRIQITLVGVAAVISVVFAIYGFTVAAKRDQKIETVGIHVNDVGVHVDNVGVQLGSNTEILTRIDTRDRDTTLVLMSKILSICTEEAVRVARGLSSFDVLVQKSLECLHMTLSRSHGTDGSSLRVAVLLYMQPANVNGQQPNADVICYPRERRLEVSLTDEVTDHVGILMSRRHPYGSGWHRNKDDGIPPGPEGHILAPMDGTVQSYIRVGIPRVGVLFVDSWEQSCSVAERRCAVAFADMLALPYQHTTTSDNSLTGAVAAAIMEGVESA